MINITAKIRNIKYKPTLCSPLNEYNISRLEEALSTSASFYLKVDNHNKFAISWWVSPKRTRSYPYARVYDTLIYAGKKITIIPVFKDEGFFGDRDFLQWDTVSLMSLLGVYVIISFYDRAEPNYRNRQKPKITKQRFSMYLLSTNLEKLLSYQSDALHWNINQLENIGFIGDRAITAYKNISTQLGIYMHSFDAAERKLNILKGDSETFKNASRRLASMAAHRELQTINPSEKVSGEKGIITITNYLGGEYHLTSDEVWFKDEKTIQLIEAKHTSAPGRILPSLNDIKDALVKMILFTNLECVRIADKEYNLESKIKLTSSTGFDYQRLSPRYKVFYDQLLEEARINRFDIIHS